MTLEERVAQANIWEREGKPSTWSEPVTWEEQSKFLWAEGLLSAIPGPVTFLDVGCYTGYFLREFIKRHPTRFQGLGVDIQRELMQKLNGLARTAGWPITFYTQIPQGAVVDAITCFDTLEHVVNDHALLKQMDAVLKPGGLMLIHLPQDQTFDQTNEEHLRIYRREDVDKICPNFTRTITEGTDEHGRATWRVELRKP